jgi:hypothetical protein
MKALLLLLLVQAFSAVGADNPYAEEEWLREGLSQQISKFKRTIFTPHPVDEGVVAANCERDPAWWGRFRVFHHTADKIDWIATEPAGYRENCGNYVLSCDWHYLEKLQIWVLEVFDSTHMGNGSLWLFEIEGHNLRLLLHTTARGRFLKTPKNLKIPPFGETRLLEEHLTAEYRPSDNGSEEAVFLSGTIAAVDSEGRQQETKPYAETWIWDAAKRVFTYVEQ